MKLSVNHISLVIIVQIMVIISVRAQESVFTGLRSDMQRADEYYQNERFQQALELYKIIESKEKKKGRVELKLAHTYKQLNDCRNSALWYSNYLEINESLEQDEYIQFAEMLACSGQYELAIKHYRIGDELDSLQSDSRIINKIWQLSNIRNLYDDSIKYSVRPIEINTTFPEFGPTYFGNGIVFVTQKKQVGGVQKIDPKTNNTFLSPHYSEIEKDTIRGISENKYGPPKQFASEITSKYNRGRVAFFQGEQKMIYSKNYSSGDKKNKKNTLKLFFAKYDNGKWLEDEAYPYNSEEYSLFHPMLNAAGTSIYFTSDMPGGTGGSDLYKSDLINGNWSEPVNLGEQINTKKDETFPFYHDSSQILYFSSNGHAGFGGFDILKAVETKSKRMEVTNLGYPVNTSSDDFGIVLNERGTNGYICSNRNAGGLNDDIFEIEIDNISYPLLMTGNVKYKSNINDSEEAVYLSHVKLTLIDLSGNIEVSESLSDDNGSFRFMVPYAGHFVIRVVTNNGKEKIVSLDIRKNNQNHKEFHIVVIEDTFNKDESLDKERTRFK